LQLCSSKLTLLSWAGPLLLVDSEIDRIPDGISGVYALQLFDLRSGMYPVIYVGQAADLKIRLLQHASGTNTSPDVIAVRSVQCGYFSAAPVPNTALRLSIESGLIRLLRPPCNRQVPRALAVFPNVPPSVPTPSSGEMHVRSCR
jgi:hypothetical protein